MERSTEDTGRKREYIVVKHGQQYYYARASKQDPDQYDIMASCTQKEAKQIVERANETSTFNHPRNSDDASGVGEG